MSRKVLLIDCQLLQTTALHRGMGKYTLALLAEYQKIKMPYDEIVILLGEQDANAQDERLLTEKLKHYKVVRLPLRKTDPSKPEDYPYILKSNRAVLNAYIDRTYHGSTIDFLIASLFHEDGCSAFPEAAQNKYLLVYDLIPLQFPDYYLKDIRGRHQYLTRFKELFAATHYFTISETVANDLSLQLGIPQDRITPINGSYISRKKLRPVAPPGVKSEGKFVLMPTGDDARKNNLRAVMAFEDFNSKSGYEYKLILTSFFGEKSKKELFMQSNHIVFTGNISDEQLAWLYKNAELIFFPSEYEGLGMPPLEAVEFNKPVLCSSIDVFKEISPSAFHYCDPYSVDDMSSSLQQLLINDRSEPVAAEYAKILKKYTWAATARHTITTYQSPVARPPIDDKSKKRIAVFSPVPSGYSAIGKVVQEQHYELAQTAEVVYYLEEGITPKAKSSRIRINYLPYVAQCKNPWSFTARDIGQFDAVIYHIGNSEYHIATSIKALAFPGTVVLHDTDLSGMLDIVRNLGYISNARYDQESKLQNAIYSLKKIKKGDQKSSHIASLVNGAQRIISHSTYAHDAVWQVLLDPEQENIRLNLPTPSPYAIYNGADSDEFVIGYAGIIHAAKGLEIIKSLAKHRYTRSVAIKLFGFSLIDENTRETLSRLENINFILSPSDARFRHELEACNVIISFRPDYHGETSLSTLEALRLGRPVIVNDIGWFKELPDNLVYKVKDDKDIATVIGKMIKSGDAEGVLAQKRLQYIRKKHSLRDYVERLAGL